MKARCERLTPKVNSQVASRRAAQGSHSPNKSIHNANSIPNMRKDQNAVFPSTTPDDELHPGMPAHLAAFFFSVPTSRTFRFGGRLWRSLSALSASAMTNV